MFVNFQIEREDKVFFFTVECYDDGERLLNIHIVDESDKIVLGYKDETFNKKLIKKMDEYWRAIEGLDREEEDILSIYDDY